MEGKPTKYLWSVQYQQSHAHTHAHYNTYTQRLWNINKNLCFSYDFHEILLGDDWGGVGFPYDGDDIKIRSLHEAERVPAFIHITRTCGNS